MVRNKAAQLKRATASMVGSGLFEALVGLVVGLVVGFAVGEAEGDNVGVFVSPGNVGLLVEGFDVGSGVVG